MNSEEQEHQWLYLGPENKPDPRQGHFPAYFHIWDQENSQVPETINARSTTTIAHPPDVNPMRQKQQASLCPEWCSTLWWLAYQQEEKGDTSSRGEDSGWKIAAATGVVNQ